MIWRPKPSSGSIQRVLATRWWSFLRVFGSVYSCTASALAVIVPGQVICIYLCLCACTYTALAYVCDANHVQACCDSDLRPSCLNRLVTCDTPCEPVCSVQCYTCRTRADERVQLTLIEARFALSSLQASGAVFVSPSFVRFSKHPEGFSC